ncbi:MAG TPA: EAL domain-containing protein [Rubrivivax sp.]|nr:EAL domain-containing protein [Rubrivivax sp.]
MKPFDIPVLPLHAEAPSRPAPVAAVGAAVQAPVDAGGDAVNARTLMDTAQSGLYIVREGQIVYANPAVATMLGWQSSGLIGHPHTVVMAPDWQQLADSTLRLRLSGLPGPAIELQCQRRDGSRFEVRLLARRIVFEGQPAVMMTLVDLSELKHALRRAEWNASMLARTEALCRAGSLEVAQASGELHMSAGLAAMLALPEGSALPASLDTLPWVPAEEQAYVAGIWRNAVVGEAFEFQHRVVCADGRRLVVLHRGQLGADGRGVALLQDVTSQVEAAQRIQELATHHEVTGLPNRGRLLDQVDAAICAARWEPEARGITVLTIDIPRIASIKANMGFGAGDSFCMALAARLRVLGGGGEAVAQLGDTEFALILESPKGEDRETLRQRALHLQVELQAPVRLGATDVYPQCLIGIACFPADGDSADRLLECAQNARQDVAGGAGVAFFRAESAMRALRAMTIESALWRALQENQFELHYQPQVDLCTGLINGAEALLRWTSPELGPVTPGEFIPVAERAGLIGAIGDWVLEQACTQIGIWKRAGLSPVRVSVNLASSQLQQPDLAQRVQTLLLRNDASPAWLGVELTESMVMSDVERAAATLREIKAIGVQISLDDFGTGFSSLSCLSRLPIDVVKVDRSFVRDVTADAQDVSVTRAIINMTHGLQMRALAEGVETEGQLSLLVAAGCDECQGWWFSKALPAADFESVLRAGKRLPERYVRNPGGRRERTLLLVDDEENILSALKRLLRRDGYKIITANSGAHGLRCLAENDIDVIVSDQRMPGMTGVEFLNRAKDLYPETLRLVLSGYTELQSIIDAVNVGAIYKFLTKPWDDERLRAHIAEAFRQKELGDENRRLAQQVDAANADLATLNEKLAHTLGQQRDQAQLLEASAASLRDVFDELPVPVLGVDADGLLGFANREAEAQLPLLSSCLATQLVDQLPPELQACLANCTSRCTITLEGRRFEVRRSNLGGPGGGGGAACGHLLLLMPTEHHTTEHLAA